MTVGDLMVDSLGKVEKIMKKMIMVVVAIAAIAGIVITTVCMPEDRFE